MTQSHKAHLQPLFAQSSLLRQSFFGHNGDSGPHVVLLDRTLKGCGWLDLNTCSQRARSKPITIMQRESMDVLSDDDYDLVSNPASSVTELEPRVIHEPQPTLAARNLFSAVSFTTENIQRLVSEAVPSSASLASRTVRVYIDGTWDAFNVSHAHQLRQAKLSFPKASLLVGVFSDADCELHNIPTTTPFVERAELLRHSRWVDDVLADARYQVTLEFCKQHRIDFVAVLEGTSVDPSCDKERLKGYDDLKAHGKVIPIRRTTGVSPHQAQSQKTPLSSEEPTPTATEQDDSPFQHLDHYGIGI